MHETTIFEVDEEEDDEAPEDERETAAVPPCWSCLHQQG